MEIPQSCCPMKFISQYRHETKLEACYRNTVIVMIKIAAPLVLNKNLSTIWYSLFPVLTPVFDSLVRNWFSKDETVIPRSIKFTISPYKPDISILSSAISSHNPRSSSKVLNTVNKVLRNNGRIIVHSLNNLASLPRVLWLLKSFSTV